MIKFCETGWFGVISEDIGFENICIVAQAVADCLKDMENSQPVVLAYDTRFLSREYAWSIQRVLTANRIQVIMHKKPVPTSFLSMSVRFSQAALGIMVTGEGRPARYSGLTFRLPSGSPVSREWMDKLFQHLYRRYPRSSEDSRHLLQYMDFFPEYSVQLMENIDAECIRNANPFIASDSFFGSVGTYMQELLQAMGLGGIHIRTKPNPGFLDSIPQPNERNMAPVSKLTAQKNGHMGLFFNGDGSIIGAVSPHGKIIRTEWAAALILDEWLKSKGKDFEFYTEIFTPEAAFKFFKHYGLEVLPLYRLKEENRPLDKAVIWDSKGLRLGSFLPDWDGILQAMLLVQALCRHDLNWQGFLSHMDLLTQNRVQEHRSLSMDADHWAEKRRNLVETLDTLHSTGLDRVIEEGGDIKAVFKDDTWLGFHYNECESNLLLYYDTEPGKGENMLQKSIAWFTG